MILNLSRKTYQLSEIDCINIHTLCLRNPSKILKIPLIAVRNVPGLAEALTLYSEYSDQLLTISFVDVSAYLTTLETICFHLRPLSSSLLIYLAAAVSDFYISEENLVLISIF